MNRSDILTQVALLRQVLNSARWILSEEDIKNINKIINSAKQRKEEKQDE